ncbi:penicillin-binding protein 1A [Amaricoccus solimangrovi]|uniref:Penicillin-binding protein 1A n=1 Tax=Amaricoccus solimangrovi TaxID=2589815 RepID=A0A501WLE3_9RHOB|nr:penicillin-binding protein 1A [Amaricoccus solimangrovi]TPE49220.1 penicillin-binding protein 1A [Amaricoccus solimangrovi]
MLRLILRFLGLVFSWLAIGSVVGLVGLAALFVIYGRDLPDYQQLANYEPPTLSRIYSGEGELMDQFARERRIFTPIYEIPDLVKDAFISAEDKNFYQHRGFDPRGIAVAIYQAATQGGRLRGASTITQQVMKNFLLTGDRSGERKIKEIILATRLEKTLSKDQILELYLNEIFLGQNSYGVTAAAEVYFNKPLDELSLAEMAYLAALPQAPSFLHPVREKERAIARRNYVLDQMAQNGYVTQAQAEAAKAQDLVTVQGGGIPSGRGETPPRDYFTDEIRRQLSARFGDDELHTGGLTIRATVNPDLQAAAARALRAGLEDYDRGLKIYRGALAHIDPAEADLSTEAGWRKALSATRVPRDIEGWRPAVVLSLGDGSARIGIEGVDEGAEGNVLPFSDVSWARLRAENGRLRASSGIADTFEVGDVILVKRLATDSGERWSYRQIPAIQGGFMAMDTQTGRVLAMQGGFSYQSSVFNRATQALRQPGSSFKPFVYAAALDNGYSPATIVLDAPIEVSTPEGLWKPENSGNKYYGPTPMRTGLEQSRNLMTVRMAQQVGMETVAKYAHDFGIYDDMPPLLSYSLGAGETTLYKMVTAYAELANGGLKVEPTLVDRVQDRYGETIYRHDRRECDDCQGPTLSAASAPVIRTDAQRLLDPITDYQITSMLQGAAARGTSAATVGQMHMNLAGKTGTTNEAKDVWFIGYSPRIVAGCYMGYDTPRPLGKSAFGGTLCAPVFVDFMKVALAGQKPVRWDVPPGGYFIKIDRRSGQRLADNADGANVQAEYIRDGQQTVVGGYGDLVDGGWRMGSDVPLYEGAAQSQIERIQVRGQTRTLPSNPSMGSMSSGGLY